MAIALTKPNKNIADLSLTEFKKMLHAQMQDTLLDQYHEYLEAVKFSTDPEVKRKCVAMHIQTIGAEHKEKVDPNANLPIFNFTFSSTGMSATTTLPMVQEVQPGDLPTLDFEHLANASELAEAERVSPDDGSSPDDIMAPWED
jgi:hypothetical protein